MDSSNIDSFHLAYVPAHDLSSTNSNNHAEEDAPIVIRKASALRLYRCRSHHTSRRISNERDNNFCTDHSSGNNSTDNSEHQSQSEEECHCCCCRVERCSVDSLLQSHSCLDRLARDGGVNSVQCKGGGNVNNAIDDNPLLLAVLVPSSLTRSVVNLASQHTNTKRRSDIENTIVEEPDISQKIRDAEVELRKSIHPCLCKAALEHSTTQSDCLKSNQTEEHEDIHIDQSQLKVCGIITSHNVSNCVNFPADAVLLSTNRNISIVKRNGIISQLSNLLNHETASNAPWSVIKAFPIQTLTILPKSFTTSRENASISREFKLLDEAALPCCPVCLSLIEPTRLGLPELKPQYRCSQWCAQSNMSNDFSQEHSCPNEIKFLPWPPPADCTACRQRELSAESTMSSINGPPKRSLSMESPLHLSPGGVQRAALQRSNTDELNHDDANALLSHPATSAGSPHPNLLVCHQCDISTTLWSCLTCGFVGCGRYTLKHAAQHYTMEGHPFSLELATGRIWCYENGTFVHRRDLVECPVLSTKWGIAPSKSSSLNYSLAASSMSYEGDNANSFSESHNEGLQKETSINASQHNHSSGLEDSTASCRRNTNQSIPTETSKLSSQPKKSIMIGHEYEALLQSALEDQAQHYEGEISRLRSKLASSSLQNTPISDRESREIISLQKDSERIKQEVEMLSATLLEAQTKEAKHRSMSQRLLREQSISKELLDRIRKETLAEHESGKQRMEDLEMQIADLNANLRMMSEFANNEELSQAQIFGTTGGEEKGKKQRGKKNRRGKKR